MHMKVSLDTYLTTSHALGYNITSETKQLIIDSSLLSHLFILWLPGFKYVDHTLSMYSGGPMHRYILLEDILLNPSASVKHIT